MEIDITDFFNTEDPFLFSASVAEMGNGAGQITWNNAIDGASEYPLLDTDEKREGFCRYVKGFGAWDEDEIRSWSNKELNALFIQFISGDMRESGLHSDMTDEEWKEYEEDDQLAHNIFKGDDGRIYYYVGS